MNNESIKNLVDKCYTLEQSFIEARREYKDHAGELELMMRSNNKKRFVSGCYLVELEDGELSITEIEVL